MTSSVDGGRVANPFLLAPILAPAHPQHPSIDALLDVTSLAQAQTPTDVWPLQYGPYLPSPPLLPNAALAMAPPPPPPLFSGAASASTVPFMTAVDGDPLFVQPDQAVVDDQAGSRAAPGGSLTADPFAALPMLHQFPADGDHDQHVSIMPLPLPLPLPTSMSMHHPLMADMANSVGTAHAISPAPTAPMAPMIPINAADGLTPPSNPVVAGFRAANAHALSLMHPNPFMMALAQLSAAQMSPPPTVTPAQVTLPRPDFYVDGLRGRHSNGFVPYTNSAGGVADPGLESFARIEFADSVFQMTTYAVIIGRDQGAMEQARRDERRMTAFHRLSTESRNMGMSLLSPIVPDRSKFSKSYVSEEGGMLGPESDGDEVGRPTKRRRTSTTGSSRHIHTHDDKTEDLISNRQYVSHTPGAAAVDLALLRPSPYHVPFIGIHSPGPNISSKTKAISRAHLRIEYNTTKNVFEAIPLHNNGFFCDDVHYGDRSVVLRSGDRLQIKDVDFVFTITGVPKGLTGAEEGEEGEEDENDENDDTLTQPVPRRRHSEGGKEMSLEFESTHESELIPWQNTSDEMSDDADGHLLARSDDDEDDEDPDLDMDLDHDPDADEDQDEDEDEDEGEDADADEDGSDPATHAGLHHDDDDDDDDDEPFALRDQDDLHDAGPDADSDLHPGSEAEPSPVPEPQMALAPKKRGPGRPPKNGIMSKREQRLLKKRAQEEAKRSQQTPAPVTASSSAAAISDLSSKRKVGRPRKHPATGALGAGDGDNGGDRPEKRRYKPRKLKGDDAGDGSEAERKARDRRDRKMRAKSPPLALQIEDYTDEQLQKPNKNYGILIDEALSVAPDGLTLKQIYKRIAQRYPWFFFHTETKGWESSVRHNLIGNEAFRKDDVNGLWARVPGVELDAGKKRKATSPDGPLLSNQTAYRPSGASTTVTTTGHAQQPQQPSSENVHHRALNSATIHPLPNRFAPSPAARPGGKAAAAAAAAPSRAPGFQHHPPLYMSPAANARTGYPPGLAAPNGGGMPAALHPQGARLPPGGPGYRPLPPGRAGPHNYNKPFRGTGSTADAATAPQPVIDPRLLTAVVNLKNGLVENLKRARNPKAEAIVMSALNRSVGLKTVATENETMEAICIKGIRQVLAGFRGSQIARPDPNPAAAAAAAAGPPPDPTPPVMDAKVLAALVGFKAISVNTLRAKLGEARAEAVTLSAIDRVLGLADASIVAPPPASPATPPADDPAAMFEGIEQNLMKSARQLLIGMNHIIQGAA